MGEPELYPFAVLNGTQLYPRGWGWGWTPHPRQIGDGDGDDPPIPGKSGMGPPSPSPDKSGMGMGMGIGGSVPWSKFKSPPHLVTGPVTGPARRGPAGHEHRHTGRERRLSLIQHWAIKQATTLLRHTSSMHRNPEADSPGSELEIAGHGTKCPLGPAGIGSVRASARAICDCQ